MANQYVPALRQRFLDDMRIEGLRPKTQAMYLRAMREFTRYLGRYSMPPKTRSTSNYHFSRSPFVARPRATVGNTSPLRCVRDRRERQRTRD